MCARGSAAGLECALSGRTPGTFSDAGKAGHGSPVAETSSTCFSTVAEAFGLSPENAPRFTAFATTLERLAGQYREGRAMFVHVEEDGKVTGYYSLRIQEDGDCELNNLCVLPGRRHAGIGKRFSLSPAAIWRGRWSFAFLTQKS